MSWDDGAETKPAGGGFGGGSKFGKGFGRGMGLAALQGENKENQVNGFGSKPSGGGGGGFGGGGFGRGSQSNGPSGGQSDGGSSGFGRGGGGGGFGAKSSGFGGGGFGAKSNSTATNGDNDGDDWGEGGGDSKPKSGFGGGRGGGFGGGRGGGFGGGRGGGSGGGFGSSGDSEAPRGGGFGGGRRGGGSGGGSSGECYKCHETGHMARDCPNAESSGGGGGDRACFKCQETGHMARDCPNAGSGGGGGDRACFKCQETGHMARDCPNAGSGGGGGDRACFKCQETGHMARDCPNAGSGGGGGDRTCYKCQQTGHMARECPNAESSGGGGGGSGNCFKCDEAGHMARDCPNNQDGDKPKTEIYVPPEPTEDETQIFKSIEKGINFDKYDAIPVECTGQDVVPAIKTFEDAGLYAKFLENVKKSHYEKPTPIQKYSIPVILAGRDLMGCAQTGSGKTAAFLLPVLTGMMRTGLSSSQFSETQEPQAIIVAPTRELAIQIYMDARKFAHGSMLRPVVVYGGTSVGHQLRQVEQGAHMIVGTPGRLVDFIGKGKIGLGKCQYLILDEADRMLDMGFETEVRKIVETMGMPPKTERQTLMFSATFPEDIQKLAADFLNNYLFVTVGRVGGANTDVEQHVFEVDRNEKRQKLCDILSESGTDRTLVFVELKRNADFLACYLSQSGFPTTSIHGDRLQREREEALADFKMGRAPILIATSVAGRGLDIPEVKHVINYDLPQAGNMDEYVHRIGRTGRCGNLGKATSFFDKENDADCARNLVKILEDANQEVPVWLDECARGSMGSGFSSAGGKFASRDVRGSKFGRQKSNDNDWFDGDTGGDGFGKDGGGGDEESWD